MDIKDIRREFFKSIRKVSCNDRKRVGCVTKDHTRDYSLGDPIIDEVSRVFLGRRRGSVVLLKKSA